ncbi:hypothetical protein SAMN05216226_102195 [Halovenus aranensis]|jgi:hypothetical protein|uniref:Uncharacterized protein n=1 Tax=Halovenus aranensis TaxID=890420 RepID=A0A1G8SX75_9EURY|nr:DUF5797 family protein [Halovenus aranensis]SDJ33859.1 hypothetical protein SAMN05216226_102195 [Halovenus aranensis]
MTLSEEEARERLADIVELQPTKNADLQERWGMESGSEVHSYLESELGDYYYRNEDSLICATPEAVGLIDGEEPADDRSVRGTPLQASIVAVLPAPDTEPQSVVATLHDVEGELDTDVDEVRSALHTLVDKGIVERVRTTVPTFRLALERDRVTIDTDES